MELEEQQQHISRPLIRACSSSNRRTWTLPDDILVEIFFRLPDKSLVRFKALSKHLYLLISQICIQRSINPPPPAVGLFVRTVHGTSQKNQQLSRFSRTSISDYFTKDILPSKLSRVRMVGNYAPLEFHETVRRPLLAWEDLISSYGLPFRPDPDDLLGCCNGLLLFIDTDSSLYYVSNPLTRQSVLIPRPPFMQERHFYAALAFDPSRSTRCYKVVRFKWVIFSPNVILDIYSSSERSWSRHELEVDPRARSKTWLRHVTYFDGAFFRLSMTWHLIRFDIEEKISIGVIDLPLTYQQCNGLMGCMGVQMGNFCYANECCNVVYVWSLEKCDIVGRWVLKNRINIYDLTSDILLNRAQHASPICQWVGPIAFDPSTNVIYMGSSLVILRCNLEDNSLEELFRIENYNVFLPGCYYPAFPYVRFLTPFTVDGDIRDPNF